MELVTIGPKYQVVIPKAIRNKEKGLQPGVKVLIGHTKNGTIVVKPVQKNWADRTYGLMRNVWKDVDPEQEIDRMRDEWETKVKKLENELEKI